MAVAVATGMRFVRALSIALWVLPVLGACGATESRTCTLTGCDSGATLRAPLPGTLAEIRGYSVEYCLNDRCLSGSVALPELHLRRA